MRLLKAQRAVSEENLDTTVFLHGVAGTGKTTAAIERIKTLIRSGVPAREILVWVPQAALGVPYREALRRARIEAPTDIRTVTLGSLAYEMVLLYWPLIAQSVGFAQPTAPPHFLSLELVQYYMTRHIEPLIEEHDYFNSVHIARNRLYTQIVDNLNKSAVVGFPYTDIGEMLKSAWRGDIEQQFIYDDAQACASAFREMCREHNLLDFSLQVDLFVDTLWREIPQAKEHLVGQYRHLIIDNIEEDTPATHDILREWLPECDSAVVIYDDDGGYRRFLGADPVDGRRLREWCAETVTLDNHRVMSKPMEAFAHIIGQHLPQAPHIVAPPDADPRAAFVTSNHRFHPQMVEWTADHIASLVHDEGVNPGQIVIVAPYVPDALRYALQARLDERDVPHRAHRPSRSLREEPATRTLLTLSKLAHPGWGMRPPIFDVAFAMMSAIEDLDLVRARLLIDALYLEGNLFPFANIQNQTAQDRISFELGQRYDALRDWLLAYRESDPEPLDGFFSRLFGEVLSQPGFGFHQDAQAAATAANLIDSTQNFRQIVGKVDPSLDLPAEYVRMVDAGVIANLYVRDWQVEKRDAVLIAPAYTFLMLNQPVEIQFWLNVNSTGWAERLYQPLTHPYVLSRQFPFGKIWDDLDEVLSNQEALAALVLGLIRRCRRQIYLGFSQFGEQGFEQRGPLLTAIQSMLREMRKQTTHV